MAKSRQTALKPRQTTRRSSTWPAKKSSPISTANRQQHVDQLCDFLRIPSISSQSDHDEDTRRAAAFVADELKELGLEVEIIDLGGHPLIYAETEIRPDRKTLLFYGHYDVQPVDPLDLWDTPPFEPRIENDIIYARGACDDKGQVYTHIKALEAYVRAGCRPAGERQVHHRGRRGIRRPEHLRVHRTESREAGLRRHHRLRHDALQRDDAGHLLQPEGSGLHGDPGLRARPWTCIRAATAARSRIPATPWPKSSPS